MKICYLNHDTRNNTGAGRFYNSLSAAVKKAIPGVGIEILTSENILCPNKLKLLLAFPMIRKVFKSCDVIHALDGWPYGVIAAVASLGLKKKLIITAIGTGAVKSLYSFWKRPLLRWAYRKAGKVIAVSNNTKKEIQKFLPDLKIEVINHGVDFRKFDVRNVGNVRDENTQQFRPYILSVGALKKRKGFEYSIEAFAKIAEKFRDLKYVIVGDGSERQNLESRIQNLELDDRVIFLSDLREEELIALYKNAELFILLPQDSNKDIEGFGLVFLEAAAAGLPIVTTKETSAEDAVLDGRNGFLVSPQDFQAAALATEKILSDKNLHKSMSQESIKFAKEMSWEKAASHYMNLYINVLFGTASR